MAPSMETATDWTSSDGSVRLLQGDCLERMAEIPVDSVDAVVTDPPYGLEFMGKEWDRLDSGLPQEAVWKGRRGKGGSNIGVDDTKPASRHHVALGAGKQHGFSRCRICGRRQFSGTPCVCEDPDFVLEYRQEAPSSSVRMQRWHELWARAVYRVLKPGGHLVAFGGTRTHHRLWCALEDAGFEIRDTLMWLYGSGFPKSLDVSKAIDKAAGAEREVVGVKSYPREGTTPVTRQATQIMGGARDDTVGQGGNIDTAPATGAARQWEGWGTALKPAWEPIVLARKPLAGTVAANVQAHGTGALNVDRCRVGTGDTYHYARKGGTPIHGGGENIDVPASNHPAGRWPANVVLDEEAAAMLDAQSGETVSRGGYPVNLVDERHNWRGSIGPTTGGLGDSGGASRFFYCAKASRAERGNGNTHPTVKPLALMRWLVRLVTPPGGLVLDPFIGSGTTALAAVAEGFRCVGIDSEGAYLRMMATRATQIAMVGV